MMTRRDGLKASGLAIAAALAPLAAARAAFAQEGAVETLPQEGPLGDVWQGSKDAKDAKVTIVEYASMTCSHCAAFHRESWPHLKERYVDTGKVRFALREFPLDPLAIAAFMLARCEGNDRYYPVTDMLFGKQAEWAFAKVPVDALERLVAQAGIGKERFESCLKDQRLYDGVNAVRKRGADILRIDSTPTFFVNGVRHKGGLTAETMDRILKPLLGE
jgi:protein-disulfide isomerase